MSTCRVSSLTVVKGCLLGPVRSLGKTLLAFALLHSIFQSQICLLLQVFEWFGIGCSDVEWFALETNRDHSVVFESASKYCISDSFVDYDGYSISSK